MSSDLFLGLSDFKMWVKKRLINPPGYERIAASGVQWVDVTAGVVKRAVPQVFGELEGDFPLGQSHVLTVPHVHLAAEVKHQHLQRHGDNGRAAC